MHFHIDMPLVCHSRSAGNNGEHLTRGYPLLNHSSNPIYLSCLNMACIPNFYKRYQAPRVYLQILLWFYSGVKYCQILLVTIIYILVAHGANKNVKCQGLVILNDYSEPLIHASQALV